MRPFGAHAAAIVNQVPQIHFRLRCATCLEEALRYLDGQRVGGRGRSLCAVQKKVHIRCQRIFLRQRNAAHKEEPIAVGRVGEGLVAEKDERRDPAVDGVPQCLVDARLSQRKAGLVEDHNA